MARHKRFGRLAAGQNLDAEGNLLAPADEGQRGPPHGLGRVGNVTMQEQGVTRVLTINLNDVEKELNIK